MKSDAQTKLISALGELKKKSGQEVYFLHVSSNLRTEPCIRVI